MTAPLPSKVSLKMALATGTQRLGTQAILDPDHLMAGYYMEEQAEERKGKNRLNLLRNWL